jgi:hypothetical protein
VARGSSTRGTGNYFLGLMLRERTLQHEGGLQFDPRLRGAERQWS